MFSDLENIAILAIAKDLLFIIIILGSIYFAFGKLIDRIDHLENVIAQKEDENNYLKEQKVDIENYMFRFHNYLEVKEEEAERILYLISHDFRNELLNISGYNEKNKVIFNNTFGNGNFETFKNNPEMKDEFLSNLNRIGNSFNKMEDLLRVFRNLSKIGCKKLSVEKLNLNDLVKELYIEFEKQFSSKSCDFQFSDLSYCYGDKEQIETLFRELISNSLKSLNPSRRGKIRIAHNVRNNYSVYHIEDNGVGVKVENQDKVFQLFFKDSISYVEGCGAGLSYAKKIVERHNGKISLFGSNNEGVQVVIELPRNNFRPKNFSRSFDNQLQ